MPTLARLPPSTGPEPTTREWDGQGTVRRTSTHCPRGSQHRGRLWRPSPCHLGLRGEEKTAAGLRFLLGRSSPPRGTPADHWPLLSRVPTKRHPKRKRNLSKRLTPWLHHEGLFLRRQGSPSYFSKPPANRAPHRTSSRQRPAAGGLRLGVWPGRCACPSAGITAGEGMPALTGQLSLDCWPRTSSLS